MGRGAGRDQQGASRGGGMIDSTLYDASNCWVVVSGLNHDEWITYLAIRKLK